LLVAVQAATASEQGDEENATHGNIKIGVDESFTLLAG
jgi:hypothetical protein